MLQVHLEDFGEVLNISGSFADLDLEVRRVGLVGEGEDQYPSLIEFLDANDIQITKVRKREVLSVPELVARWA